MKEKYGWIVFCAALVLFIVKIDAFVVNVSLPTIAHSFSLNAAQASMIIVVYLLMLTNTMLIFGKLEDKIGVRKLLTAGYLLFTLGSLFSGLSPSLITLILARGVQGIGGAILLICGFGSVNKFLPKEIEGWGLGLITTAAALGIATGAPLGGFITHYFSWRWIFFINVPLCVFGWLVSIRSLPKEEISREAATQPFDYWGAVLSFIGLSGITYALVNVGQVTILLFSLAILLLFVFWQMRCKYPLLELKIFRNRTFTYANLAVFIIFMILAGADFIIPFYLQLAKGFNPYYAGLFMFLYSAAYSVCAPFAGRLLDNAKFRILNFASLMAAAVFFVLYASILQAATPIMTIVFFALWGIANAFLITENFRLVFTSTPADEKGVGSGVFNVANNLSMVFGVCLFQLIFSFVTHSAQLPNPAAPVAAIDLATYYSAFYLIFICAGLLYFLAAVFSVGAGKSAEA